MMEVILMPVLLRLMLVIWKSAGFLILGGPVAGFFENINIRPRGGVGILLYIYLQKLTTALYTIRQQPGHLCFIPIERRRGYLLRLGFQIRGFLAIQIASIRIVLHVDALSTGTAGPWPIAG